MDLRAFGGVYPYRAEVPYASGFGFVPDPTGASGVKFAACRALFIEAKSTIYPISCTAVSSGDVEGVFVLY
jgi:hypothetical protein